MAFPIDPVDIAA